MKRSMYIYLDNASVSSADVGEGEEDELENEPVRLNRPNKKPDHHNESANVHLIHNHEQQHGSSNRTMPRNSNHYPQSRPQSSGIRSVNNVSFMSDTSKTGGRTIGTESTGNSAANQLKLVDKLTIN